MNFSKKGLKFIAILTFILFLTRCVGTLPQTLSQEAVSGPEYITSIHEDLIILPKPKQKISVAVYKFRDQTGQYKPPTTSTNFSTAVTQGATSILIKALEDSGWFLPVEREGLANLLQERRIILQMRDMYLSEDQKKTIEPLPPLVYAGIIFEGGIIGYDTNITSGGLGAKYFGLGGATQYRVDRVTVYLRAVSVKNGTVLKTVQTTKVILSKEITAGIFRYVRFNRLLEAEAGIAANEPVEMAVQEAIEKAVYDMIMEGYKIGLWEPENKEVFEKTLEKYHAQLEKNKQKAKENVLE